MPYQFLSHLMDAPLPVPVYSPGLVVIIQSYQAHGLVEATLPSQPSALPAVVTAITPEGYRLLRSLRKSPKWGG